MMRAFHIRLAFVLVALVIGGCFASDPCRGIVACDNVCEEADFHISNACGVPPAPRPIACDEDAMRFSECVIEFNDTNRFMVCAFFNDPVLAAGSEFSDCVEGEN